MKLLRALVALAALALGCSAQQDESVSVSLDSNGELLSDGNVSVTLRALTAQLADLTARQAALVAEVCLKGRLSSFQSIPTVGARDWAFFSIGGESYLAVAEQYNGSSWSINSHILRFDASTSSFVPLQTIPTQGAIALEFFSINGAGYLAIANSQSSPTNYSINSHILRFNTSSNTFVLFQSIPTHGATAWQFFSIGGESYLAVSNYYDGASLAVNSFVFRFNGSSFVHFQSIPTQGAIDLEFFSMGGESYLAVASHDQTSFVNSPILRFDGSSFVPYQLIPAQGATDLEYFTIHGQSYLAVACLRNGTSWSINSQILRFDSSSSEFAPFQSIPTQGAYDWEFFSIHNQSYLAVSNFQADSQILSFDGGSFVPVQSVRTVGASDFEFFSIGSRSYLAIANQRNGTSYPADSQVFRLLDPCFP
jgi:hypothetical protein